jgi:hypothetical protein
MEKVITLEGPLSTRGVTLLAVVRSTMTYKSNDLGAWLFGLKLPVALVLITDSSKRAFRTTGEEVPVEQLLVEFPDISIDLSRY